MLICKHAFEQWVIPINPFTLFGYYLYELVDRDLIRNANNNIIKRCDELWVYGEISDGVLVEIQMFQTLQKPIRYFDISHLPQTIQEITTTNDLVFEEDVKKFAESCNLWKHR